MNPRALLLLIALIFVPAAAQETEPSAAPTFVACATCAGQGQLESNCWACDDGDHACSACDRFEVHYPRRWLASWAPDALIQAKLAEMNQLAEKLKGFDIPIGGRAGKKAPKATEVEPGELRCPARCRSGELLHIQKWVDCKLCKKGKFRCSDCKQGRVECELCQGAGSRLRACDDCAGVGRVPDASAIEFDTCPWCLGKEQRACGTCDDEGLVALPCLGCLGRLSVPCSNCLGLEKTACHQCGARGRYGPQKKSCDICRKKGVLACKLCDDGLEVCSDCNGQASAQSPCPDCASARQHPCNGCTTGAYTAWLYAAERARERGDLARASGWLEAARERCDARYRESVQHFDQEEESVDEAVQREWKDELAAIDERLAKLATDE